MGMIPGKFKRVNVAGLTAYISTTINGITTSSYGNYGSSFFLVCINQFQI
jgi:hypothetical protein